MKILSIIIPCYNEAKTFPIIIKKIREVSIPNWDIEIIVVDDGSGKETKEILKKYEGEMKIIYHEKNKGKGSAVQTGIANANGDYIVIQDADLEYEPDEIPFLIEVLERQPGSIIYGSRNLHHVKKRGVVIPRIGVWFITKQFNFLFGTKLTDIWTCYKLFPRETAHLFVAGKFESELIFSARVVKKGYKIAEVAISHKPRSVKEGKKIRYRDGIKGIWVLLKEYFR